MYIENLIKMCPKRVTTVSYNMTQMCSKSIANLYNIILERTPEIGQGLGRILSCGARKPEQT